MQRARLVREKLPCLTKPARGFDDNLTALSRNQYLYAHQAGATPNGLISIRTIFLAHGSEYIVRDTAQTINFTTNLAADRNTKDGLDG